MTTLAAHGKMPGRSQTRRLVVSRCRTVLRSAGQARFTEYGTLAPNGTHCILELYDCSSHLLNDEQFVRSTLAEAVERGFASLIQQISHQFHPQGVTALGLISESHISIHTWPECGYVAADVFTCGDRAKAEAACDYLIEAFGAGRHSLTRLVRGSATIHDATHDVHTLEPSISAPA